MDRATNLLTMLGALFAIGLIAFIGAPAQLSWWLSASGVIAWALSPYAVMWLLNNVLVEEQRQRDMVLLLTCMVMVALEGWNLSQALLDSTHAGPASALQQLPLIQLIVVVVGGAIAYLIPVAVGVKAKN